MNKYEIEELKQFRQNIKEWMRDCASEERKVAYSKVLKLIDSFHFLKSTTNVAVDSAIDWQRHSI